MRQGKLFIISGPSGTGKGTLCKRVLAMDDDLVLFLYKKLQEECSGKEN